MSNISVSQGDGPMRVHVARSERISSCFQRVTFTGDDLARLRWRGFDQWVRLFLPTSDPASLDHVPDRITRGTYARLLTVPARRRPSVRSYTLRAWRPDAGELDIDFVLHGDKGVAGPWAASARPGDRAALLDQGCGWTEPSAQNLLLAADETGLPAVVGVLRDLPRSARGCALVEIPDLSDAQSVELPSGMELRWLVRSADVAPGAMILGELPQLELPTADRHAFAVGESALATGARRHLVRHRGWGRREVTFCGYWKR